MKPEWSALGEALHALRAGRDLLQKQVAGRTHDAVTGRLLRQYERGERRPDRDRLIQLLLRAYEVEEAAEINRFLELAAYSPLSRREIERLGVRSPRLDSAEADRPALTELSGARRTGSESLSAEDVRHQLGKILASETFRKSTQASRLLQYVVHKTLDGRADELKETVIAMDVFGQKADPLESGMVRASIRRLRDRLAQYYHTEGSRDPIQITIPTGRYKAVLGWRAQEERNLAASELATLSPQTATSAAAFELFVDPSLSSEQIRAALDALADYYRACGGVGLQIEFEHQEAEVRERVDA